MTDTSLAALPEMTFAPLNVLLLVQDEGWQPRPLLAPRPDDAYAHRRGLITKADVRALSLARLALRERDVVWDVGAATISARVNQRLLAKPQLETLVALAADHAGHGICIAHSGTMAGILFNNEDRLAVTAAKAVLSRRVGDHLSLFATATLSITGGHHVR